MARETDGRSDRAAKDAARSADALALILWATLMILAVVGMAAIWIVGWPMVAGIVGLLIYSRRHWT